MKSRYGFTSQGKKNMIKELRRQAVEVEKKLMEDIDAMILWTAHVELGFGKKRLKRFYRAVIRNFIEMCEYYQMNDTYPAEYKLREIGVDMDELRKENKQ